jgi:hypothetical protein
MRIKRDLAIALCMLGGALVVIQTLVMALEAMASRH